ncbi:MAG: glycosyltransferase family 2 protein [Chloroflexi bacterium]|nr:glycosyltransferase family 2 protein [Chloroflexota bacterium]
MYATVLYWTEGELPLIERCLRSLDAQEAPGTDLRILVIDNGSGVTPGLPGRAELVRLPCNRGFTGGHNVGTRAALEDAADFVFLINSDVVLEPSCVARLLQVAHDDASVGILGPLILSATATGQIESNGLTFNTRTGRHRQIDRGLAPTGLSQTPHAVDAVSGAALFARRSVLERVGFLDDALYLYFEDVDLCLRARGAGFQVVVVPGARASHVGGGSTAPAWTGTTFYSVRNHLVVAARNAPRGWSWLLQALVISYHFAFLLRNQERRTWTHLGALVRGSLAAWTSRMGPQGSFARSH